MLPPVHHSYSRLVSPTSALKRLSIRGATRGVGPHDIPVISIRDPNALTQVIGWLKFTSGSGRVLFRGQSTLYPSLYPSGLRDSQSRTMTKYSYSMKRFVSAAAGADCRCRPGGFGYAHSERCEEQVRKSDSPRGLVARTYRAAVEPLLQHYGLRTRWLDLVDNIWIALWFGCQTHIQHGRHASHLLRSPDREPDGKAYIVIVDAGPMEETGIPGYWIGANARLVDLRYAVPSIYLRPHAQHGWLIAPRALAAADPSPGDLAPMVSAALEINLGDALNWMGSGQMLSTHVLFPPATHDGGYRRILDYAPLPGAMLGDFAIYGPSSN